ncbi:MAG: ATP-binding protein, partial [Methanobacterium sp.]
GITNVVRHADASTVTIRIISQNGNLFLSLKDDGIGFNPQILLQSDKVVDNIGLWGIRERVKIVKGDFYIKSHPGKGTELEIRVPINQVEMENA